MRQRKPAGLHRIAVAPHSIADVALRFGSAAPRLCGALREMDLAADAEAHKRPTEQGSVST
jgi:hypothetical protein